MIAESNKKRGSPYRRPLFFSKASVAALLLIFCFVPSLKLGALDAQEFSRLVIRNETGYTLQTLFISPSDSRSWGADVLAGQPLSPTKSRGFLLNWTQNSGRFDLYALDQGGRAYRISSLLLYDEEDVIVYLESHHQVLQHEVLELTRVHVTNASQQAYLYCFIASSDSRHWGADVLGDQHSLESGETRTFYIASGRGERTFDLLALGPRGVELRTTIKVTSQSREIFVELRPL